MRPPPGLPLDKSAEGGPRAAETVKHCPMCEGAVFSDAQTRHACALCGMPVQVDGAMKWEYDDDIFLFCGERCYERYTALYSGSKRAATRMRERSLPLQS